LGRRDANFGASVVVVRGEKRLAPAKEKVSATLSIVKSG
jgi:hypothetical protein